MDVDGDTIATVADGAQDLGLAALLGGKLFGRYAMHPALAEVSDERERGKVVNRAWRRYGLVNGLGLAALVAGWVAERAQRRPSGPEWRLVRAKDAAVGAVAVSGLAAAVEGLRFAASEPEGAVPLEDGSHPAPDAPREVVRRRRVLNALSRTGVAAEVALLAVTAALRRHRSRRMPGLLSRVAG
jgi:hypothetical protein